MRREPANRLRSFARTHGSRQLALVLLWSPRSSRTRWHAGSRCPHHAQPLSAPAAVARSPPRDHSRGSCCRCCGPFARCRGSKTRAVVRLAPPCPVAFEVGRPGAPRGGRRLCERRLGTRCVSLRNVRGMPGQRPTRQLRASPCVAVAQRTPRRPACGLREGRICRVPEERGLVLAAPRAHGGLNGVGGLRACARRRGVRHRERGPRRSRRASEDAGLAQCVVRPPARTSYCCRSTRE
ncbi:hypothetical protein ERJ75_001629400 [Trypanosoma vivax]|nr:hypothetical protein ERJ75_001629400 [Trypanosoma vivax]